MNINKDKIKEEKLKNNKKINDILTSVEESFKKSQQ